MESGYKLLRYFRKEQEKRGNVGCMCSDCVEDMQNAINNFMKINSKTSHNNDFKKLSYIKCKTESCRREVNKEGDYCGICRGL